MDQDEKKNEIFSSLKTNTFGIVYLIEIEIFFVKNNINKIKK